MANPNASNGSSSHDLLQNGTLVFPTSSDQKSQERLSELREKVFGNDIILQEIIQRVINIPPTLPLSYHSDITPNVSGKEARNLRLVSTKWLDQTTCYFQRIKKPLFRFKYSFPLAFDIFYKDRMVEFLNFLDALDEDSLETTVPSFSLIITLDTQFSHPLDYRTLQTLFSQKTSAPNFLVRLTIWNFSLGQNTVFPEIPAQFKLPSLIELSIMKREITTPATQDKFNVFIQSVLDATVVLKLLRLRHLQFGERIATEQFHWKLPRTLIRLETSFRTIFDSLLTCISSAPNNCLSLPHLKELSVFEDPPLADHLPFKGNWMGESLGKFMPKLEKLFLFSQRRLRNVWCHPGWKNWLTVKTLYVVGLPSIPLEVMHAIHHGFGAVVHLSFDLLWNRAEHQQRLTATRTGLTYIFQEMTQLKSLKIYINMLAYTEVYEWDSIIIGTTTERAKQLRDDPKLWNDFIKEGQGDKNGDGDKREDTRVAGIMNLKQLKSVGLCCNSLYTPHENIHPRPTAPPIISSLVFRLGFMQLPDLDHLTLDEAFSIGMENIVKEWQELGSGRTVCFRGQTAINVNDEKD